jgi:hypothetical protein
LVEDKVEDADPCLPNKLFLVQFFITYAKQPSLDGKYTIFGRVIDGADSTLDAMEREPVNAKSRPLHEITLDKVTIHANPVRPFCLSFVRARP